MIKYNVLLILSYFYKSGENYSYKELLEYFGLSMKQLDNIIEILIRDGYIILEKEYKVTNEGIELLKKNGIVELDYSNLEVDKDSIFTEKPLNINDIYVPKRFTKKYSIKKKM